MYPGDPRDDFSPELVIGNASYRNLALHRPAFHSGSYDDSLTAQLITDGIKDTDWPTWVATSTTSTGMLSKVQREVILDHSHTTTIDVHRSPATVQIQLGGGKTLLKSIVSTSWWLN